MSISNPAHWKEPFLNKGPKYDKIMEIIAALNLAAVDAAVVHLTGNETIAGIKTFSSIPVLPASDPTTDNQASHKSYVDGRTPNFTIPSSPYTVEYPANVYVAVDMIDSTALRVSAWGVYTSATGTVYQYYDFHPPDWLCRYAEEQGKDLKATSVTVNFRNTISGSYLTRFLAYFSDGQSNAAPTTLHDDATDYGNGNTTFQNPTYDITDSVAMTRGDFIHVRLDYSNSANNGDITASLEIAWSIT